LELKLKSGKDKKYFITICTGLGLGPKGGYYLRNALIPAILNIIVTLAKLFRKFLINIFLVDWQAHIFQNSCYCVAPVPRAEFIFFLKLNNS
jgi:hypothetical protein